MRKVYITGLGLVTSIGNNVRDVEASLRGLKHGFELYPPFDRPEIPVKVVGTVKGFDTTSTDFEDWTYPEGYSIRRELLRSMAPNGLYAHCAMLQAIADAGLGEGDVRNPQTGIYCASGGSPFLLGHLLKRMREQGVMRCPPTGIVASIAGTLNFNLVAAFKIEGVSCGFSSACASTGHAIGFAYEDIVHGRQDRVFIAGAEDGNYEAILPFAGMRALSLQTDLSLASRPFDAARDGFVGTGGGAVLVLESEEEVARRGVKPYAELAGWGQASDGHNVAMSHPEGAGLARAMRLALEATAVTTADVDYINAHATSTPIGDISEARAIRAVFGEDTGKVAVSSTKALTGHGLSLATAMETAFCAIAMRASFIPGAAHLQNVDPECADLNLPRQTVECAPRVVLNNTSGFGGANVTLVLKSAG
ncbi:MAG TPA: beta-ketoacyl-[acyl-carrier-protein] synthase family protein [Opitutaceae bacterium]|nr:beta-ketoacyl-[acyl-carrier-protein] synthase family protein [Opitutaceae bacterium]